MVTALALALGEDVDVAAFLQKSFAFVGAYQDFDGADALDLVIDAIVALPRAAAKQDHRFDHLAKGLRYKPLFSNQHLFQRLVLTQSQIRYEKLVESGRTLSEQGMRMFWIGGRARTGYDHGTFVTIVGMDTVLRSNTPGATLDVYRKIDPWRATLKSQEKAKTWRRRMTEDAETQLRGRIHTRKLPNGERRIVCIDNPSQQDLEQMNSLFDYFIPWDTGHCVPDRFKGMSVKGLSGAAPTASEEKTLCGKQFHAAIDRICKARITTSLGYKSPDETVEIPDIANGHPCPPGDSSPQPLLPAEIKRALDLIEAKLALWHRASRETLIIRVDGKDRAHVDGHSRVANITVSEREDLIEIVSARDGCVLETFFMDYDDELVGHQPDVVFDFEDRLEVRVRISTPLKYASSERNIIRKEHVRQSDNGETIHNYARGLKNPSLSVVELFESVKVLRPYFPSDVWLIDRKFGTLLNNPHSSSDLCVRPSSPDSFECALDPISFCVEKIAVSGLCLGFMVCRRENPEREMALRDSAKRLQNEAQSRWNNQIVRRGKSFLAHCNSEKTAVEATANAARLLFGPGTNSHAYHAFAANPDEAQRSPINLIFAESTWCAPTSHPRPSHIAHSITTGTDIYEPDVCNPTHKGVCFHFEHDDDKTRTSSTVFLNLSTNRRGAFQSISVEVDAFGEAERKALAAVLESLVSTLQRLMKKAEDSSPLEVWTDGIITRDRRMLDVVAQIERLKHTNANVLIRGESGTGKELVARATHDDGSGAEKPFVALNCAAISDALVESELFGCEKGAFTGAAIKKKGLIELANGGTLFLDEIADLSLTAQAKLLRAIQEHEILRLGGEAPIHVDIRVVAATHRDLEAEVESRRFREDLYYRLAVVTVALPPLRDRLGDIPLLAKHLITEYSQMSGKHIDRNLSSKALKKLRAHSWPGNVRELRNVLYRAVINCDGGIILPDHLILRQLSHANGNVARGYSYKEQLLHFERKYFRELLERNNNNKVKAAEEAGLDRRALYDHLYKAGLLPKPGIEAATDEKLRRNGGMAGKSINDR